MASKPSSPGPTLTKNLNVTLRKTPLDQTRVDVVLKKPPVTKMVPGRYVYGSTLTGGGTNYA